MIGRWLCVSMLLWQARGQVELNLGQGGGGVIDVGNLLGSVIDGFINPQGQGTNNQLQGAISGFEQAFQGGQNGQGSCSSSNGGCSQGCRQQGPFARCFCQPGYALSQDGRACDDVNECNFGNAGCRHICSNTPGSFACSCSPGFTLGRDGVSCRRGGGNSGGNNGGFVIPQQPGGRSCNVDNGGCDQLCRQGRFGGVECGCQRGYQLARDQRTCSDFDECRARQHRCQYRCENTEGSFKCICPAGFVLAPNGRRCRRGAQPPQGDTCSVNNGGCEQGCNQLGNAVSCFCQFGFTLGRDQKSCEARATTPAPTAAPTTQGPFTVSHTTPAPSQVISGACWRQNGGCHHVCQQQTFQTVRCFCNPGFKIQPDNSCTADGAAGCSNNNGGCDQLCRDNRFGQTQCGCNRGYRLARDGKTCDCQPGFQLSAGHPCQQPTQPTVPPTSPPVTQPTPRPTPPTGPTSPLQQCGFNPNKELKIESNTRIVGGRPASPQDWPSMAALITRQRQYCGATLITRNHVLSAAHCVAPFDASDITVRLGEYDFENGRGTEFGVKEIISHKDYSTTTQENDIAVLKMDGTATFGDLIQPACLALPGRNFANEAAMVIGWGTTSFGGSSSSVLMQVQVPVWSQDQCKNSYGEKVFPKMMCAGIKTGGKDSCQGDSGGPLLTQLDGGEAWFLIGVVSWGIECARPDRPGVYTRVNEYLDWIDANTN